MFLNSPCKVERKKNCLYFLQLEIIQYNVYNSEILKFSAGFVGGIARLIYT